MNNKNMPINLEAEKSVLASILLNGKNIKDVIGVLTPDDFYHPGNELIYKSMLELEQNNILIDLITLKDELEKTGNLDKAGGIAYLIELQEDIPSIGMTANYAKIVKDKSIYRMIIKTANEIASAGYSQKDQDVKEFLNFAENKIFKISSTLYKDPIIDFKKLIKDTINDLQLAKSNPEKHGSIKTGYQELDKITRGFSPGEFIILAARPSMGKTGLAMNMATNMMLSGVRVGIFSLEMTPSQLLIRMLSQVSRLQIKKIVDLDIGTEEWDSLSGAIENLDNIPINISSLSRIDMLELCSHAKKMKAEKDIQILFIDYLQLIRYRGPRKSTKNEEITEISRDLKSLALELNIPIVVLSQLSREYEKRVDKRPVKSDLRDSGSLEQDVDMLLMLYRDFYYNKKTEYPEQAEIIIEKHRTGDAQKTVYVRFIPELVLFEDYNTN